MYIMLLRVVGTCVCIYMCVGVFVIVGAQKTVNNNTL